MGGLLSDCTLVIMHLFLQGPRTDFYAIFASVLYGVIYALGPRRPAPTAALTGLVFI